MALVLRGSVVTFDRARPIVDPGVVCIGDDGRLGAVLDASDPLPAAFAAAPVVDTHSFIYPGLIDLHSHVQYNTLPLWEADSVPYLHHDRWPDEDEYSTSVSWPAKVLGRAAPEALLKYVQVKALAGGTTSIQGAPRTTRPVQGWLVRLLDVEKLPAGVDIVETAVIQEEVAKLIKRAKSLKSGHLLIYHAAEGKRGSIVRDEFDDLDGAGCLRPGLIMVHGTALVAADFGGWQSKVAQVDRAQRGTVVWSPFSNYWLYHMTTDVLAADAAGIRIALGSDWSPSGTKNVLGELKVADAVNKAQLGGHFTDQQLCEMVTANPGDALAVAWGPQIGRLLEGNAADLLVCERVHADPYRNLIQANERHVRLVLVRGKPFYGTRALMKAAGAPAGEVDAITVAGKARGVVVRQPAQTSFKLDWPGVKRALKKVLADPAAAWESATEAMAAWGGALDDPEAPLMLFGDMPEGDASAAAGGDEPPADLTIPPLDSLAHDGPFFAALKRAGPPELQPLRTYYP